MVSHLKIESKFHGPIEIQQKDIITFDKGIPGFEDKKKFIVVSFKDTPFNILQSVTTSELAFITVDPFLFFKDYDFTLSDSVIEVLQVEKREDVFVLAIITLHDSIESSTANLQAPVIINKKTNAGKQVVLHDENYSTKHSLGMAVAQEG